MLYSPATNTWTPMASQGQGRGYHSTAILLPDARVLSAGDDTVAGGGWENDIAEIYSPPYLFAGPPPLDHLGAARHQVGLPVHDRHVRRRRPGRPDRPRRDDPRQRHEPAPRGAGDLPDGRRHPGDRAALGQRRAPRPVHALPPERAGGSLGGPLRAGRERLRPGRVPRAGRGRLGRPAAGGRQEEAAGAVPEPQAEGRQGVGQPRGHPRRPPEPPGGGRHPRPPRPGTRDGLHQEARAEEGQEEAGRLPGAGAARPRPRCSFGSS